MDGTSTIVDLKLVLLIHLSLYFSNSVHREKFYEMRTSSWNSHEFDIHSSRASHPFPLSFSHSELEPFFLAHMHTPLLVYIGISTCKGSLSHNLVEDNLSLFCLPWNKGQVIITRVFSVHISNKHGAGGETILVDLKCKGWTVQHKAKGAKCHWAQNANWKVQFTQRKSDTWSFSITPC